MLGLMGVDHRSRRKSSTVFFNSCLVLSVVFRVLTCLSVNLLDLGKGGMR